MHVEHDFVTVTPPAEIFQQISTALRAMGFTVESQDDLALSARKGKPKPGKAASVDELPQTVKLRYDRGRVELAVAAELKGKTGGVLPEQQALLIARRLEAAVRPDLNTSHLAKSWNDLLTDINDHRRSHGRKRKVAWIALSIFMLLVVAAVVAAVMSFESY